jgi:hypothetical protein
MKAIIVINEAHNLRPVQKRALTAAFDSLQFEFIPYHGLNVKQQYNLADYLIQCMQANLHIVFVSPVPLLINLVSRKDIYNPYRTHVFVRETRQKRLTSSGHIKAYVPYDWCLI